MKEEFDALFAEHQKLLGELQAIRNVKRTWVRLTEDEAFGKRRDYFETYKAIEAKYKEENMKHEKTFNAISKLKEVELELHRLKNELEMANRALDAQRTWADLTDDEMLMIYGQKHEGKKYSLGRMVQAKLKEKNH